MIIDSLLISSVDESQSSLVVKLEDSIRYNGISVGNILSGFLFLLLLELN